MYVLRTVQESDDRVAAMRSIKEPKKSGGSEADQTELMQILAASATADKQAYCRLSAIEALDRFEDPRAVQILVTAYRNASIDAPGGQAEPPANGVVQAGRRTRAPFAPVSSFTADQVITIQSAALEALGKKRTPEAPRQ
jgi:hypothetical protein